MLRAVRTAGCYFIAWLHLLGLASAQLRDSFETPNPSWFVRGANCGVTERLHERTPREARSGQSSEHLRLEIGNGRQTGGTFVYLAHSIGRAPLIEEFKPSVFLKADRASLQLMARVVFPRSIDRGTGQPITTLLRGDFYTEVGAWQQLSIPNPAKLLAQETRALRTQFGDVDSREAYVDLIVLNAYSAPGPIDLWIDDLEIEGYIDLADAGGPQVARRPATSGSEAIPTAPAPAGASVQGSLLMVRGRPLAPRIIQHRGEPLEWLKSLGFNTIKLGSSPSPAELKEARRLNLWLIAPPPYADATAGEPYDPVIAWSLGSRLTEPDLSPTRDLVREIHTFDPQRDRPLFAGVEAGLADLSRLANLLQLERPTLFTTRELADLRPWLLARPRLAQPGTPLFAAVESQRPAKLSEQLLLFSRGNPVEEDIDPQQIRLAAFHAIAAGARGLVFPSEQPLAVDTGPAALRTDAIKLLNMELKLLEPWLAAGQLAEELPAEGGAAQVSVLQSERSRLLIVTQHAPAQQYVLGPPPRSTLSLVVPGVGVSDQAHLVSLDGIKPLKLTHTSGGGRLTLEDAPHAVAIAVTQDPLALLHLHRTQAAFKQEACRLRYDVTARRYIRALDLDQKLAAAGHPLQAAAAWLRECYGQLEQSRKLLTSGDLERSQAATAKAENLLARVRRGHWEQTAAAFPSPAASPLISQVTALPLHWQVAEQMGKAAWGPNVQVGGDMENLDHMLQAGWQQQRSVPPGMSADVSLSLHDPHSGRSALRLRAWPADPARALRVIERPPVWIASSPVAVREGQLVRIRGWVHVPQRIGASDEGLLVFDSIGGAELGDRIRLTQGWREFTLYRAAGRTGELSITFALTGLGEASLDDLQISLLDPEPIRPRR